MSMSCDLIESMDCTNYDYHYAPIFLNLVVTLLLIGLLVLFSPKDFDL